MADSRNKPVPNFFRLTPAPAAGVEINIAPNTGAGWLFQTLRYQFNTDANVATREMAFAVTNGDSEFVRLGCPTSQTAGQQREYSAAAGANMIVATLAVRSVDWPDTGLWVPQGYRLVSVTSNIQAGDQYANVGAWVIEFPTGPREFMWPFPTYFTEESS